MIFELCIRVKILRLGLDILLKTKLTSNLSWLDTWRYDNNKVIIASKVQTGLSVKDMMIGILGPHTSSSCLSFFLLLCSMMKLWISWLQFLRLIDQLIGVFFWLRRGVSHFRFLYNQHHVSSVWLVPYVFFCLHFCVHSPIYLFIYLFFSKLHCTPSLCILKLNVYLWTTCGLLLPLQESNQSGYDSHL